MHIIASTRSSAANRSALRNADRVANTIDAGGYKYIDVSKQPKRYLVLNKYGDVIGFSFKPVKKVGGR